MVREERKGEEMEVLPRGFFQTLLNEYDRFLRHIIVEFVGIPPNEIDILKRFIEILTGKW